MHTPSLAPESRGVRGPGWLTIRLRQVKLYTAEKDK